MKYDFTLRTYECRITAIEGWTYGLHSDNDRPYIEEEDVVTDGTYLVTTENRKFQVESTLKGDFTIDEIGHLGYHDVVDSPILTLEFANDDEALAFVEQFDNARLDPWSVDFVYDENGREVYAV